MAKEAILVIHGMGQQNPYETLDQFARGLIDQRERSTGQRLQPAPLLIAHEGWNEVAIRLELGGQPTKSGATTLDLYEFYWAPYTEGKITYRQVLVWLRRAVLTPLRYLATSYELFNEETRPERLPLAFLRELFRVIVLFLPVAALTVVLGFLLAKAEQIPLSAAELLQIWSKSPLSRQIGLVAFVGALILIGALYRGLMRLSREQELARQQGVRGVSEQAASRWAQFIWLGLGSSILAAVLLGWWLGADLFRYGEAILPYWFPVLVTGGGHSQKQR